jgi:catechol 2,3-dioxygenase-like lactoylglutathione lyase family enzyme
MALKRMDNVGIVVDDLGGTIDFFRELGLELEGRATTSAGLKGFSLDSPKNSVERVCFRRTL